jgi:hypothetical protein
MKTNTKVVFLWVHSTAKRLTILRRTDTLYLQIKKLDYQNTKANLSLVHVMKAYGGSSNIAPFTLNLDTRWRRTVSFMLRPPYPLVKRQ